MFDIPELIIMVIVILVIIGGSQLPRLARNITASTRELGNNLKANTTKKKTPGKKTTKHL